MQGHLLPDSLGSTEHLSLHTLHVISTGIRHPRSSCNVPVNKSPELVDTKEISTLGNAVSSSLLAPETILQITPLMPSSFKDVLLGLKLRCIDGNLDTEIQVFEGVSTHDFGVLEHLVETWSFPESRPKLSYDPHTCTLIIEMPTSVHEFSITDFGDEIRRVLAGGLLAKQECFRTSLEHNLTLLSPRTGFLATPNLALVAAMSGTSRLLALVECAFSQDRQKLLKKIQSEIEGWPEIVLVVMIVASELMDYRSPKANTVTWDFFAQHELPLSQQEFLALPSSIDECIAKNPTRHDLSSSSVSYRSSDSSSNSSVSYHSSDSSSSSGHLVLSPVTIAGHTWCQISNVQYHVWVKKDGVINLHDDEKAVGSLYPEIAMDDVEAMLGSGLSTVKGEIVKLAMAAHESQATIRKLQQAELAVNFNWREVQVGLRLAAEQTAMLRYGKWFHDTFHGTKHPRQDDEEYQPSESDSFSSNGAVTP